VRAVDSRNLALVIWLLGALLSCLTLQVSLEFGCMLPRSGGEKTCLEFAYPRPRWLASTVVAVWVVLGGVSSSNCIVFAKYVLAAAGSAQPGSYAVKGIAALLLTSVVVAHGCFYGAAVKVQNVLGAAKIGFVAFLILTSVYVVALGSPSPLTAPGHAPACRVTAGPVTPGQ
jgi:amino acid transporter